MVGAPVVVGVEQLLLTGVRAGLGRHQAHGQVVDALFVPMLAGFDPSVPLLRQAGRALRLGLLFGAITSFLWLWSYARLKG